MKTLMPHQQKAIEYAKNTACPAFFMEMRLGKTLTTIRWAYSIKRGIPHNLVLCPKSVRPAWVAEIKEEGFDRGWISPVGSVDEKYETVKTWFEKFQWVILNYESIVHCPDILELPWDLVICDESTRLRSPQSKTSKYLCRYTNPESIRCILSGLPNPESLLDYFQQFKFLYGSFLGCDNYWAFRNKFFIPDNSGYCWEPKSWAEKKIRAEVARLSFELTRKDAGLGSKKIYESRYIQPTKDQLRLHKEAKTEFSITFNGKTIDTKWAMVKAEWMHQIAGGILKDGTVLSEEKNREIEELLGGELKGQKVVIWFKHNVELDHTAEFLSRKGYHVGIFKADTKTGVERNGTLSDSIDVMCAQGKCGMFGLDWSKASCAMYYSNWYDNEIRHQTEDRIVHPRKKEPLLYIDLLTKNTIDEDIKEIITTKKIKSKGQFVMALKEIWRKKKC